MAGLLSSEVRADSLHFLQDVAVTDCGARETKSRLFQGTFQSQIRHGRTDNRVALQRAGALQISTRRQEHAIAIDQFARGAYEERTVRVSVKCNAQRRAGFDDSLL